MPTPKARAKRIKLLLFDVDGVMTDGSIWLFPTPAGAQQGTAVAGQPRRELGGYEIPRGPVIEAKGFNAHDGAGISLAKLGGLKTGIITKRISETVALRARDLRLDHVYQGIADKLSTFREILKKEGISEAEATRQYLAGRRPAGRFVALESVAAMVVFLCGPTSRDTNGAAFPIDGGWLAT